jgi:hypothetical protein
MASGSLNPLYWMLGAGGAGLVYSAVKNEAPIALLRSVISGGETERQPIYSGARHIEAVAGVDVQADTSLGNEAQPSPGAQTPCGPPVVNPELVGIGQGSHQLTPKAANAFKRWAALYGAPIYVTDSYRSYAHQKKRHDEEPDRFANPDTSCAMHTRGLAVDVDLGRTTSGQSTLGNARYDKLYQTAALAGWCTYGKGKSGTHTWHFAYGRCA